MTCWQENEDSHKRRWNAEHTKLLHCDDFFKDNWTKIVGFLYSLGIEFLVLAVVEAEVVNK